MFISLERCHSALAWEVYVQEVALAGKGKKANKGRGELYETKKGVCLLEDQDEAVCENKLRQVRSYWVSIYASVLCPLDFSDKNSTRVVVKSIAFAILKTL